MCIVTSQYSVYVQELTSNTMCATTRDLYRLWALRVSSNAYLTPLRSSLSLIFLPLSYAYHSYLFTNNYDCPQQCVDYTA